MGARRGRDDPGSRVLAMRLLARLASLWQGLFGRARMDAELDEELASYFDDLVARRQAEGLSLDEARRLARREMGSVPHVKAAVRESWLVSAWDQTREDVAPGVARARRDAGALGPGGGDLRARDRLGDRDPRRAARRPCSRRRPTSTRTALLLVWADMSAAGYPRAPLSGPELQDLRTRTTRFERFGAVWANSITITHDGEPEFVRIGLVTPELLPACSACRPLAGRRLRAPGRRRRAARDDPAELPALAAALRRRPRHRRPGDQRQRAAGAW